MNPDRLLFEFDTRYRVPGGLFGVTRRSAYVEIDDGRFVARFGRWTVDTPLSNIVRAERSGPFSVARTIGPARLSAADRGLTFATNDRDGVCLTFREPVTGIDPLGVIKHPGLTVTVADPGSLLERLRSSSVAVST